MRSAFVAVGTACLLAFAPVATRAERGPAGGGAGVRPPEHDVSCTLVLARNADLEPGATVDATLLVRNRAKNAEPAVALAVYADDATGTPLWSATASLRGGKRLTRNVRVTLPEGATSLVGYATVPDDENTGNDADSITVGAAPGAPTYAQIAPLLAAKCATCHHGASAPNGVRLATFASSAENASAALAAMQDGLMPRRGSISHAAIARFAAWVAGGKRR